MNEGEKKKTNVVCILMQLVMSSLAGAVRDHVGPLI